MAVSNYTAIMRALVGATLPDNGTISRIGIPFGNKAGWYTDSSYSATSVADSVNVALDVVTSHSLCNHKIRVFCTTNDISVAVDPPLIEVSAFLCDNSGTYDSADFGFTGGGVTASPQQYGVEVFSLSPGEVRWPVPLCADGVPVAPPSAVWAGSTTERTRTVLIYGSEDIGKYDTTNVRPATAAQRRTTTAKGYTVVNLGSELFFGNNNIEPGVAFNIPSGEVLARNGLPNFPVRVCIAARRIDTLIGRSSRAPVRLVAHISPCAPIYADLTRASSVRVANTVVNPVPVLAYEPLQVTATASAPMNVSIVTGTVTVANPVNSVSILNTPLTVASGSVPLDTRVVEPVQLNDESGLKVDVVKVGSLELNSAAIPVTTVALDTVDDVPYQLPLAVTTRPWDGLFPVEDTIGFAKRDTTFTATVSGASAELEPISVFVNGVAGQTLPAGTSLPIVNGDDKPLWVIEGGSDIFS